MKLNTIFWLLSILTLPILVNLMEITVLCNHLSWPQLPFCLKYPLHWAATTNRAEIVENMLINGADVNQQTEREHMGNTALHIASRYGRADVIQILIKYGGDATIKNNKGELAMDRAIIKWCNFDSSNIWCKLGDFDYPATLSLLHNGCTSVGCADEFNCVDHRCLKQRTHEQHYTNRNSRQIRDVCGPYTWYWWSKARCRNYPFHWAAVAGDETKVETFLRSGKMVDHRDEKMYTPLMLAAWAGRAGTVSLLLQNGADRSRSARGQTALLQALQKFCQDPTAKGCRLGEVDYVETIKLLRQGCLVTGCDAGLYCKTGKCQKLNNSPNTPSLHKKCGPHIWADWSEQRCQDNPFHWAALIGDNAAVTKDLELTSVDRREVHRNRNTPLMHAAWAGHASTVSLLLDHGADTSLTNAKGQTALNLATEKVCTDSWPGCRLGKVDYDETFRILRQELGTDNMQPISNPQTGFKKILHQISPQKMRRTSSSTPAAETVSGTPCVRFKQQGRWYEANECKCCSNSKPWCAISVSPQGHMVQWGYCKQHHSIRPLLERLVHEHERKELVKPIRYTGY